jgi:outer membrane receptor protein involved in Fe transport
VLRVLGAACGLALVSGVARAEPAHIFRLPSEPVDRALVRFAVQGGVSVGGFPAPGCDGDSRPVLGVLKPSAALRRLLPEGCAFERVDAKAFRILASRRTAARAVAATVPADIELTELVVTAEKRREPLLGSPFAVSVVSGDDIQRLGASSFADLALQVPGVAETNLGPGRDKIFIRGLSDGAFTGRTQSTVGLYLDEVPITYNAPDPNLRLADIEQVEVLRGPQGTLYGAGSIGGIVRIVTAKPDLDRAAGRIVLEGMLNEHSDRSSAAEVMLNLPLPGGRAAVRGVAYSEDLAGYLNNPRLGLEDVNHGRRSGVRVAGLIDLGDSWRALGSYVEQAIETADGQYVQGAGRLSRDTRILEPHDNDISQFGATISHSGSWADIRVSGAYIDHDLSTRYDATGAFDLAASQVASFDESQKVELWVAEALFASAGAQRLRWLGGAFVSHSREKSAGLLDASLSQGAVRSVYVRHDHLTEAAVFGELTYDVTARLTATVGGRLFTTWVETLSSGFGLANPPAADVRGRLTDQGFAQKLRLSYAFAPDVVIYGQIQDGYRAGGFNVPAVADGLAGGPSVANYRPDSLRSYEIGGEAALFHQTMTVRAAVFRADWSDVQTDQFRPSGLPVTLNIGDGSNTGLEVEAVWRPGRHWRLQANGLVDDPELTRSSNIFPARVDVGLPGVARTTASVAASYRWTLASGLQMELSAQAAYVGRSFLTFDGASATSMGNYGQGRVAATLRGTRWQAQAYVDNVTDESGDTFAFGNPFSTARSRQATPLPPRTFGLAVRRSF